MCWPTHFVIFPDQSHLALFASVCWLLEEAWSASKTHIYHLWEQKDTPYHPGSLLFVNWEEYPAMYETAQRTRVLTQYLQWLIKTSWWKRKVRSCIYQNLESTRAKERGFKEDIFSRDLENQLYFMVGFSFGVPYPTPAQVYSVDLEQNVSKELSARSVHKKQDLCFSPNSKNYGMVPLRYVCNSTVKKSTH